MKKLLSTLLFLLSLSLPLYGQTRTQILQDNKTANGNGIVIDVSQDAAVAVQITGTFSATINFEGNVDGATWVALKGLNLTTFAQNASPTAAGIYSVPLVGVTTFRARISGYVSGTINVVANVSNHLVGKSGGAANVSDGYTPKADENGNLVNGSFIDQGTYTQSTETIQVPDLVLSPMVGDLPSPTNGQFWYNITTGKFRARQAGSNFDVIGGGISGSILTFPKFYPAAGCGNTTPAAFYDLPTANIPVPVCSTGTNTQTGFLEFPDIDGDYSAQVTDKLPDDFTGQVDAFFRWRSAATSGDVIWKIQTACVADGETDDPSWNTASTVTDTAKGTTLQLNHASISNITITGCAAGETIHYRLVRNRTTSGDTIAGTVQLSGFEIILRRQF